MKKIILILILWSVVYPVSAQVVSTSACVSVTPSAPALLITSSQVVTLTANPAPAGFAYRWYDSNGTTQLSTSQAYTTVTISASKTYYLAYYHTSSACLSVKVPVRVNFYSEDRNWTREYSARDTLTADYALRNSSQKASYKQTTYHDGLGRVNQQVAIQASVNGSDIITPVVYDAYGRPYRDYLPVPNNTTNQGLYRPTATLLHSTYYTDKYADSRGYADKTYESSPLNRVLKQGVPGTAWVGHELENIENVNLTQDQVKIWTVNTSGLPVDAGVFAAGALSKVEMQNEQDQRTIEYKDKLGRLILKKVQIEAAPTAHHVGWMCTYYIYDKMGKLRVVMTPKAVDAVVTGGQSSTLTTISDGLYYLYSYDARGRLVTKKIPDKGIEELVYDLQDRLVASRDALLTAQGKWLFAKYDALGREVMTGLVTYSGSRTTLQTLVETLSSNNAVINSTSGKTGTTNAGGFPRVADGGEGDVLTVNYYDNYAFRKSTLTYVKPTGYHDSSTKTTGLLTGTLVKNLGNNTRYETAVYYDSQGRLIQTISDHHLAGTVRISSKYDFENKPQETITQHTNPSTYTITKGYVYNAAGALSHIAHKINSGAVVTLANHTYNQLGELGSKAYPAAGDAVTSFTYNIRGWLKKINDPQVSNATSKVFAQELFYEVGGSTLYWNGNIGKAEWRGQDDIKRVYIFTYDIANRIKTASYTVPTNTVQNGRYNLGYINYDANGNITTMQRVNAKTSSTWAMVDNLSYSYSTNSNKLSQVLDHLPDVSYVSQDFKNRNNVNYTYDANGNLTVNGDKEITSITYNHLNLPLTITFSGTNKKIDYWYDAQGMKLRQVNTDGATVKTLDYLGELVFENSAISYVLHEEGRATYESSAFQYEFFVKDHLGNVRQVIRAPISGARIATMEPENAEEEEKEFEGIRESRQGAGEHNKTPGGYATAWLNAGRNRILGPSRSQEVQQGDSVELGVFGKYVDPKKFKLSPASFVRSGMDKKLIQQLTEYGQNLTSGGVNEVAIANVIALVITELQQKPVPEAYMGYALYDSDSTLYEQGKVILSKKARNKHEELIKKIAVPKDGYIETYLVNETSDDVWFDQFRILSTGPLIVQETHYDPWGVELSGLGYQYGGIKVNPYLYNGKEANGHLGVNLYDFGARLYDPAIGRWFVSDPMAEKMRRHSPYNYAFNNPLRYIDPDGMEPYEVMGSVTTSGESESQEDETEKSVVNEEETAPVREEVMVDTGYGQMVSSRDLVGVDYIGNFETKGKSKKNTSCCQDKKVINQLKSPNEISRADNNGYGYVGNDIKLNGVTYYKMSDKRGNYFWVDKNWNSMKGINMFDYFPGGKYFENTDMGRDINSFFKFIDKVVKANQDYGRTDPSGIYTLPLPSDPDGFSGRPYLLIPLLPRILK